MGHTPEVTPQVASEIASMQGGGEPLPASERAFFEPRFGHDFSQVLIHADGRATQAAEALQAQAFTVGRDVVFGTGEYQPGTDAGRVLLSHELTHVVQQKGAQQPAMLQRNGGPIMSGMKEPSVTETDEVLAWIHGALDAAGLIPALGVVPDAINAGIYTIEGDWVGAGFSAAAMVPVFGQGAILTKYGVKVSKEAVEHLGREGAERAVKEAAIKAGTKGLIQKITQEGLDHSFDRHAAQWFGREVPRGTHFEAWEALVERVATSNKYFDWSTGPSETIAHIARVEGRYFVVQFYKETGELATAFSPNQSQLSAMLELIK